MYKLVLCYNPEVFYQFIAILNRVFVFGIFFGNNNIGHFTSIRKNENKVNIHTNYRLQDRMYHSNDKK